MNSITIAKLTFREASRRKILLAALLLGALFLTIYGLGYHFIIRDTTESFGEDRKFMINQVSNFLLMAGMYVVNMLTAMMTVLTSVDTLSGEIQSGAIQTVVAKPVRRWEIVAGKWLGFAAMLTLYLLLMGGGVMAIVYLRSGYTAPHPLQALSLMWLNAVILLSISLLGGASLSTLANGVLVFGLFGVAFIGGWIEQIGAFMPDPATNQTAMNIGVITSLIMPSEALWKRAAFELQSPLLRMMGDTPFTARYYPSDAMMIYSIIYLLVVFALSIQRFNQRDL
ncbi:MAG: ABC transporter permease subunit [Anaerolineales bacterium]|nr:ABC transporter permease subunit [Anaerolineales bacterium]